MASNYGGGNDPGPDFGAIGNAATGSKRDSGGGRELREFSVKRGDNGGVTVCETYRSTPPEGRRYGASFPDGSNYTENPFSPDDGAAAADFVTTLMAKMGVTPAAPAAPDAPPDAPAAAAVRGPLGGGAIASTGGGGMMGGGGY